MPVSIGVIGTKGGIGKTTIVANTGAILADMGLRVLMIDCDVQPSLSKYYPLSYRAPYGIVELLLKKDIEKEISEFAKKWAVDRQALTFYVLNFDTGNKDDKQLGETALRESANYEEFLDKTNKNKLQYRKGLNIAIKEFAARLHEEYHL